METKGLFHMPIHSAVYLWYGSSCAVAKEGDPYKVDGVDNMTTASVNFALYRVLNPGYWLCGSINCITGYPGIQIGADGDELC